MNEFFTCLAIFKADASVVFLSVTNSLKHFPLNVKKLKVHSLLLPNFLVPEFTLIVVGSVEELRIRSKVQNIIMFL